VAFISVFSLGSSFYYDCFEFLSLMCLVFDDFDYFDSFESPEGLLSSSSLACSSNSITSCCESVDMGVFFNYMTSKAIDLIAPTEISVSDSQSKSIFFLSILSFESSLYRAN